MTKFRFVLSAQHRAVVKRFKELNALRTEGRWRVELMEFPPGDPDTVFMEFVTEHAADLLAAIETNYCTE
jgi:hypothetical protein